MEKLFLKTMFVMSVVSFTLVAEARYEDAGLGGSGQTYNPAPVIQAAQPANKGWSLSWTSVKEKAKSLFNIAPDRSPNRNVASTGADAPMALQAVQKVDPVLEPKAHESWKVSVQKVKELKVVRALTPGKKFNDKNLIMGHNDVPVFEFKKFRAKFQMKKVVPLPLLNIGEEQQLDAKMFPVVEIEPFPNARVHAPVDMLSSPELMTDTMFKTLLRPEVIKASLAEKIDIPSLPPEKRVTAEKINQIVFNPEAEQPVTVLAVTKINDEDLKLLRGLILFEKKDYCHIASGIFSDLTESKSPSIQMSSRYHLGVCLQEMHVPTEAIHQLTSVIKSQDVRFTPNAIKVAAEGVTRHTEDTLVEALLTLKDDSLILKETLPDISYLKAKYFVRKGQYQQALSQVEKVPTSSGKYFKAQYVGTVSEYFLNKYDASMERSRKLAETLTKKGVEKDILALTQINMGRMAFQKGKYKDSMEAYQKVTKDNSLWIQALTEQGWAQIQSKDSAGAIGNMHSIQSPYFEGVFKPEGYIVRSIGYLNICQYADSFKTLTYLEQKYEPWLESIQSYSKNHDSGALYATVSKFIDLKLKPDVDGLPNQVLREIARQKDFLNAQESFNQLYDENTAYPFIKSLVDKDKKSLLGRRNATVTKVVALQQKIKKASVTPNAMKNFNAWKLELAQNEDFLNVYEFKMATYKEGEDGLKKLAAQAQERIGKLKVTYKESAGKILKSHMTRIVKELKMNFENNEFLKYEVYAGSGENIRYQVAGGKTKGGVKIPDRKVAAQNWEFEGEFWEDEIGNYRSSLKNNCKKE